MTTVCHNKYKKIKNLKIIEIFIYICYNENMKKIFLLTALLMIAIYYPLCHSGVIFASETNQPQLIETNINNINTYDYFDIYGGEFLFSSSTNNIISIYKDNNNSSYNNYGGQDNQISAPKFITKINSGKFAVLNQFNGIKIFDKNFNFIKRYEIIQKANESFYSLGSIADICKDYSGNLYILDYTNNKVLYLDINNEYLTELNIANITLNENCKISTNANGNKFAILDITNKKVNIYNLSGIVAELTNITANDIMFDCLDNLFTINIDSQITLTRYKNIDFSNSGELKIYATCKSINIDIETGMLYFLNDNFYSFDTENFTANASTQNAPVDITSTSLNTEQVAICKTTQSANLYATCVSFSSSYVLSPETFVAVLKSDVAENVNMSFVLTNINGDEKYGYIETQYLSQILPETNNDNYKTICKNVSVLTYPTQNAGVAKTIQDENTQIVVIGKANNFVDFNNNSYYTVKIDDKIGYINQNYLTLCNQFESTPIETTPTPSNSNQFIAFILAIAVLFIVAIFILYIVNKNQKNS